MKRPPAEVLSPDRMAHADRWIVATGFRRRLVRVVPSEEPPKKFQHIPLPSRPV